MTRFLVLLLAFTALAMAAAHADERLRVDLYLAENGPPPPDTRMAPGKLHEQLQQVFGFQHYELLQTQALELHHEWEQWFMPRRDFFMRVVPQPRVPGSPRVVDYDIYKDGFVVASGHFEPRGGTPLFINGPDFHQGRLILVLEAKDKDED
jgi:hypothetical protein